MNNFLQHPEVSVLMPAYNREELISASIKSILDQTFTNFELIILDDGSTDNTINKILDFKDNRIRLLKNDRNRGISYSRNRLLSESKGNYIALLDSDDIALPTRLQVQIDFLKENSSVTLVGAPFKYIDIKGVKKKALWSFLTPLPTAPEEIKITLLFRNSFFQSSIMINRSLFKNEQYDLKYPPLEDYKLWTELSRSHKLCNLNKTLALYRSYPENISHQTNDSFRFQLFNEIIKEQFKFYFNYEPTEEELRIHSLWCFDDFKENSKLLKESSKWLYKLQEINRQQRVFDPTLFNKVLKRNWFDRCWRHLNKGNLTAPFNYLSFLIDFSLKDIFIFVYFLAKGIYSFSRKQLQMTFSKATSLF